MLAWATAEAQPWKDPTANTVHVLRVASKILLEKLFFGANTFQNDEAKCCGWGQGQPGTNSQRAGGYEEQHSEIAWVSQKAIGPTADEPVSALRLQPNLG